MDLSREDRHSVLDYLHYGYLPDPHASVKGYIEARAAASTLPGRDRDVDELVREGGRVLRRVFRESVAAHQSRTLHVVPISGGVDSRTILAGLLENLDPRQIVTFSYGTPGTWDFELGRRVAKELAVEHHAVDLTGSDWSWDIAGLRATAQGAIRPVWLFAPYVRRKIAQAFGNEALFWTGFMGEVLGGNYSWPSQGPFESWKVACEAYAKQQRFVKEIHLTPPGYDPTRCLPPSPLADPGVLDIYDQLEFSECEANHIRVVTMPEGSSWCAPFLHPEWVSFILGVPRALRRGEMTLYNRTVCALYPFAFSIPTRKAHGLPLGASAWRRRANKVIVRGPRKLMGRWVGGPLNVNYVDFDKAIRTRTDLGEIVQACLGELEASGVKDLLGFSVTELWAEHQRGRQDFGKALTLLASLAIELSLGTRAWSFD